MIAAVIPAYNADGTLTELLQRLSRHIGPKDTYVVDDGSTDATSKIVGQSGACLLRHDQNRGKGAALRTGIQRALSSEPYEAVFTLDADLQHDPEDIPVFLASWRRGGADVLVGSRKRFGSGMPLHRILSNVITSALVSVRAGTTIKDSQSGFRLISTEALSAISVESNGYEAETEFLIRAATKGFKIGFVPIATIYGNAKSHMTHWETTTRFLQVLLRKY